MTDAEIKRAEVDAERDAEWLALRLLLAFRRRDSSAVSRVSFDSSRGVFIVDGKSVTLRSVYKTLDRIRDRYAGRLLKITLDLDADRITLAEWKRAFDRSITSSHILFGAFALGGIAVAARNATVIARISEQLAFGDAFSEQIRAKKSGTLSKIAARAKSYLQAPHLLFTDLQLEVIISTGFYDEARNVLRPAEHCASDANVIGCPELSLLSWMPVVEMVPVGRRRCGGWCKCFLEFR
ncbi:MAG: hypothetical protein ABIR33_09490 [Pyrinomonadaceae bacterium]